MIATEEQQKHIDELLEREDIYHTICNEYDWETETYEDCTSVYIDGNISFDTLAEIVDYLRGK